MLAKHYYYLAFDWVMSINCYLLFLKDDMSYYDWNSLGLLFPDLCKSNSEFEDYSLNDHALPELLGNKPFLFSNLSYSL